MSIDLANAKAIFLQAAEQSSAAAREALLSEACGNDSTLRQHVEMLLTAHEQAGSFLEQGALAREATLDQTPWERPGTQIGPYKLLQKIGEGGMGVVYLAEQILPVQRRVALKLIKAGMDSGQVIARFEAERQALALMDHPNIAKVLDAGTTKSGHPYFVMELVNGIPVTQFCDEQHLTTRERLELFVPICQAVQHAHQKGIIHRDIKPSNILVALYDGRPVPKVIDFGVAKATSGRLTEKTMFTGLGQMVGTLEYMSPEQAQRNQLDIDTRSDIYSLGVVLYELLTGDTPFDKRRLQSAALDELLRIIREEDPPKPSTKLSSSDTLPSVAANRKIEPAHLSALVRGELDWIVMKALEKDRNQRYETANSFADDVLRYLNDEPVQACPPSTWYQLQKIAQRNRVGLAIAGLVLLFLILLGTSIGWAVRDRSAREANVAGQIELILNEVDGLEREQKWPEALAAARRAEAAMAGGEADAATAERVHQRLKNLEFIDRLEQIRMQRGTWIEGKPDNAGADREYARAFRNYGVDVVELSVASSIDRFKARPTLAIPLAAALDDWVVARRAVAEQDAAGWKGLVAVARGIDPDPLRDRLRSTWGQPVSSGVQDELRRVAQSIDIRAQLPPTLVSLALTLVRVKDSDAAVRLLRNAQFVYPGDFWINFELGRALHEQKDFEGAIRFYTAAVAIRPQASAAHNNLGLLVHQKKLDEAIVRYEMAIELDPNSASAQFDLGNALKTKGNLDKAERAYREAVRLDGQKRGLAIDALVELLLSRGNAKEAVEAARKAVTLDEKSGGAWQLLGWALYRVGDWQASIAALEKSCALQQNPSGGDAGQWFVLAMAHWRLGHEEEAREWFHRAEEWSTGQNANGTIMDFGGEAAELLDIPCLMRGRYYVLRSQWDKAAADYARADWSRPLGDDAFEYACLFLVRGDQDGYDKFCREMIQRAGKTKEPYEPYFLARICAISAKGEVDPAQTIVWAKQMVAGDRAPWCVHVLGLSEYRAGHFRQASQCFTEASVTVWCGELCWFGLSLAHHRLGHAAEARQCLQKGIELLGGGTSKGPPNGGGISKGPPIGAKAADWLEAVLLCREAEALLNAKEVQEPTKK